MRKRAPYPLLLMVLTIVLLHLTVAAPPAQAKEQLPKFWAWDITATFASGAPLVIVTTYTGTLNPVTVLESTPHDISASCVKRGNGQISYQNGRALFDGNAFLRCPLPLTTLNIPDCEVNALNAFFFGADVKLDAASQLAPLLTAANNNFAFSLFSNGAQGQTRVVLPAATYQSTAWPRDNAGNEVLLGQSGELMNAANDSLGLLGALDPSWKPFFQALPGDKVGHRMFAPAGTPTWRTNAVMQPFLPPPAYVFIGHNPATGATLRGELVSVEGDPPGCTVK